MGRTARWKIEALAEANERCYEIMDEFDLAMLTDYHWKIEGIDWWPSSKKYMIKGGKPSEYGSLDEFLQVVRYTKSQKEFFGENPEILFYVLDENKKVKTTSSLSEWNQFLANGEKRTVKRETVSGIFVSTVFLGIDHNFSTAPGKGPILFETMWFQGEDNSEVIRRYRTWDQAMEGHNRSVSYIKEHFRDQRFDEFAEDYLAWETSTTHHNSPELEQ